MDKYLEDNYKPCKKYYNGDVEYWKTLDKILEKS